MISLRVGVVGAVGRMGRMVCDAVDADPSLEVVARVDIAGASPRSALVDERADVAVHFSHPDGVIDDIAFCAQHGIHSVVGTSGFTPERIEEVRRIAGANVFIAPNFSVAAVLMMSFARQAAQLMGSCEVIELHHNQKLDAPSGTALATARMISDVWEEHGRPPGGEPSPGEIEAVPGARGASVGGVRVHSVRLHGLVAHQEVQFGATGEILTIRHDTIDRTSFLPGVVLAVKSIAARPGLTVGLEHLLGLA